MKIVVQRNCGLVEDANKSPSDFGGSPWSLLSQLSFLYQQATNILAETAFLIQYFVLTLNSIIFSQGFCLSGLTNRVLKILHHCKLQLLSVVFRLIDLTELL